MYVPRGFNWRAKTLGTVLLDALWGVTEAIVAQYTWTCLIVTDSMIQYATNRDNIDVTWGDRFIVQDVLGITCDDHLFAFSHPEPIRPEIESNGVRLGLRESNTGSTPVDLLRVRIYTSPITFAERRQLGKDPPASPSGDFCNTGHRAQEGCAAETRPNPPFVRR
jgi:hypothetical protein